MTYIYIVLVLIVSLVFILCLNNHLQGMKGPPGMDGEKGVPGIAGPRVCTFSVYKPQIRPGKKKTISLKFIEFIMAENLYIFVLPPLLTNIHPQ